MGDLLGSVVFVCDRNTNHSSTAEAIMKHLVDKPIYADSAGVQPNGQDFVWFTIAGMWEIRSLYFMSRSGDFRWPAGHVCGANHNLHAASAAPGN